MATPRRQESPWAKLLIGGGVTIALEMGGGHFLEFLKIACVPAGALPCHGAILVFSR